MGNTTATTTVSVVVVAVDVVKRFMANYRRPIPAKGAARKGLRVLSRRVKSLEKKNQEMFQKHSSPHGAG